MNMVEVAEDLQFEVLREINTYLNQADLTQSPSHLSNDTNRIIRELTGVSDFYLRIKQESNVLALSGYPFLQELSVQGEDTLAQVMKIAASGNVIDVVHMDNYDLWDEVRHTVAQPLLGEALATFRAAVEDASYLLYLADNAGETVFDRILIEMFNLPVIYAVKGGAILNDATMEDALASGIDKVARIIETGSRGPGTILSDCSDEFLEIYSLAPVVLAKGQANYETLQDAGEKVFNLLRIKCPILGREAGFPMGRLALIH